MARNSVPKEEYRRVAVRLDDQELAMADQIADMMSRGGAPRPTRSTVLRLAVEALIDELDGKSKEEILQFFVEGARRRGEKVPTLRAR